MILAGGPSDAGGSSDAGGDGEWSLMLDVMPIGVALLALAVSAATFLMNSRKAARDALWSYLQLVVSSETARARSVIRDAANDSPPRVSAMLVRLANRKKGSRSGFSDSDLERWQAEVDAVRDAASQLLWVVALAGPASGQQGWTRRLLGWRNTELYSAQVYEHLNLMIPELMMAMMVWREDFQSEGSARIADAALDSLPPVQKYGANQSVTLTTMRLAGSRTDASGPTVNGGDVR